MNDTLKFLRLILIFSLITINVDRIHADEFSTGIPEGYKVIEGDIIVPKDFGSARAVWRPSFWPNGIVFYEFDSDVTTENRNRMLAAMQEWQDVRHRI